MIILGEVQSNTFGGVLDALREIILYKKEISGVFETHRLRDQFEIRMAQTISQLEAHVNKIQALEDQVQAIKGKDIRAAAAKAQGVDFGKAGRMGVQLKRALALPGKQRSIIFLIYNISLEKSYF